jgi:Holliday junction resolvasome RuvABC endonuclease subunit
MRILAIDQSLSNTGYAIFDNIKSGDKEYYYIKKIGTITPPTKLKDFNKKLQYIYSNISTLISKNDIQVLVYEGIFKHLNVSTLIKLAKVQGIVELLAGEHNLQSIIITPKEWQAKFGLDKIKDNKDKSIDYIRDSLHIERHSEVDLININNHIADAILIGMYYITIHNEGIHINNSQCG